MFKNREVRVQMVKTPSQKGDPTTREPRARMNPYQIDEIITDHTKQIAMIVGTAYVVKKVLDTVSEISLIAARSNFK